MNPVINDSNLSQKLLVRSMNNSEDNHLLINLNLKNNVRYHFNSATKVNDIIYEIVVII